MTRVGFGALAETHSLLHREGRSGGGGWRRFFRQNEQNSQNRGNGVSEMEGKGAMGSAE